MTDLARQYYKSDFRKPMMLLALIQMIGMAMIPLAIVVVFFTWKVATLVGGVGILLFWKFGDLNVTLGHKWCEFSGVKKIQSEVLYGEIEKPETAGKFRLVAEDVGGLYREGNEIVLGSLNGEVRCSAKDFDYEIINKSALVNYLIVRLGDQRYAFFPKWNGDVKEQPTSPQKVEWAEGIINQIVCTAA